jgi:hypothetical protein
MKDPILYENYSSRVRSAILVCKDVVYYAVEVYEHNEWVTKWSHTVPWPKGKAHLPLGPAFRNAAIRQDVEATECLHIFQPSILVGEA